MPWAVAEIGPVMHFFFLLHFDSAGLGAHPATKIGLNPIPGSLLGPCHSFSRPLDWVIISGTIVLA